MPTLVDRRLALLFAVIVALLGIAALRAAYLGTIQGSRLSRAATAQQVENVPVPALRGTIEDRRGRDLAVSEQADDIAAVPYLIKRADLGRVAHQLAPIVGQPEQKVLDQIARRDSTFVILAHQVKADRARAVRAIHTDGLELIPHSFRTYPLSWVASQVLGWMHDDGRGAGGLEYRFEKLLHGRDGTMREVKDALGQPISMRTERPTVAGRNLRLTLDTNLQEKVEGVLRGIGEVYKPKGATAIVMDPRTGAVLALANWPQIDANDVGGAPASAQADLAVGMTYEPGSTFKAVTVAGALQDAKVTPSTLFNVPVNYAMQDRTIHDAEVRGPETMSVSTIMRRSSNVGAVEIGQKVGTARFSQWVNAFGFGLPTGIDLPGEEGGIVPPLARYSGTSMINLPIGQGLSVTPMQMATAYAAIANGGILRPPHVVDAIGGRRVPTPKGQRVISVRASAALRTMLAGVFAVGGTAHEADIPGYALAGKTGTANKVDATTGQYSDTRYVASFAGFVPVRNPHLLVTVVVDEPQAQIYGSVVAAPAFQKIVSFAVPYLGISPR